MDNPDQSVMEKRMPRQLVAVLAAMKDEAAVRAFLRDVLTEKEIIEVAARFEAAKMLTDKKRYTEVIDKTGLSSRTVARISDWLQNGAGGYASAIATFNHLHAQPDSSE